MEVRNGKIAASDLIRRVFSVPSLLYKASVMESFVHPEFSAHGGFRRLTKHKNQLSASSVFKINLLSSVVSMFDSLS